jgi:hypothetical protein
VNKCNDDDVESCLLLETTFICGAGQRDARTIVTIQSDSSEVTVVK